MTFTWPAMLVGLLTVPALVLAYRSQLRRRERGRARLAAEGLVPASVARPDPWRHVAPILLLAALTLLLTSLARPAATVAEPRREGTVILAFDVSTSMAAKDLAPTRLEAAKAAARTFVAKQPSTIRLGVVAFGDSAVISQQPTNDRGEVLAAIERAGVFDDTAFFLVADHGMEETNPAVQGDWSPALRDAGISFRDETYGFLYLNV
jgi:Ca-activated chloride channel family protein